MNCRNDSRRVSGGYDKKKSQIGSCDSVIKIMPKHMKIRQSFDQPLMATILMFFNHTLQTLCLLGWLKLKLRLLLCVLKLNRKALFSGSPHLATALFSGHLQLQRWRKSNLTTSTHIHDLCMSIKQMKADVRSKNCDVSLQQLLCSTIKLLVPVVSAKQRLYALCKKETVEQKMEGSKKNMEFS